MEDYEAIIDQRHKACQYLWAKKCGRATWLDYSYVVFSDESRTNLFGSYGWQYYWRRSGEHLLDWHVQPIVKFLWFEHARAMEGVGNLCLIEGKMNKYVYCEVLEMELMNTIHMNDLGEEDVIFQHDNDPKHTFKYVTNWWLAQKISFHLASGSITWSKSYRTPLECCKSSYENIWEETH